MASELRHSRRMIRHQRQRVIQNRANFYKSFWHTGIDWLTKGKLSKWHSHHHRCEWCKVPYKRERFDWKQALENGP